MVWVGRDLQRSPRGNPPARGRDILWSGCSKPHSAWYWTGLGHNKGFLEPSPGWTTPSLTFFTGEEVNLQRRGSLRKSVPLMLCSRLAHQVKFSGCCKHSMCLCARATCPSQTVITQAFEKHGYGNTDLRTWRTQNTEVQVHLAPCGLLWFVWFFLYYARVFNSMLCWYCTEQTC